MSHYLAAESVRTRAKKDIIDKMELTTLINRSDIQRQLYKSLVDAYEADKILLDTYGDTVTIKRPRDGADDDQEPSAGTDRGSKRKGQGKDLIRPVLNVKQTKMVVKLPVQDLRLTRKSAIQTAPEVYKATTEKLDWINPEGRQYPHDLRQPLPLVPNSQGRRVIPFHHFINNDLEYLRGGVSSRKYSTSVTKTKAADYGHIKWIEDLVPNSMWSQMIVHNNTELALWGISHREKKAKRRLSTTKDSKTIEDMLLLPCKEKVTNLNVEERIALISHLERQDAYTPYSDPRDSSTEQIQEYQIDAIERTTQDHDVLLDDVRTALNDRLKVFRMCRIATDFLDPYLTKANAEL
ncbi:hypothetical protein Tco_0767379 [Tanacetum coccineum]